MVNASLISREDEKSVSSYFRQQEASNSDSLLRVQVESSLQKTTFYVPVSLMLQREVEMQQSAKQTQIGPERWSGSRLYSLWKENPQRRSGGEITLRLEPESVMMDYSDLQWKPWLTACIRAYYNSGNIRIPEECVGSDILLALEYFGILTSSPDTFIFESPQALGRIKAWSSYFTYRMAIANWVIAEYKTRLGGSRNWVTTPNPDERNHAETLLQVNGGTAAILGDEADRRATSMNEYMPSCQVIHHLFFDNEATNRLSKDTPMKMRRDFSVFLQRLMEPLVATVSFEIERVKITKSSGKVSTTLRAVLRMEVDRNSRSKVLEQESRQSTESNTETIENHAEVEEESGSPIITNTVDAHDSIDDEKPLLESAGPTNDRIESYGSDSEILHVTQIDFTRKKLTRSSPNGNSKADDSIEAPSEVVLQSDHIEEERHPHRSTPIPEGKRTSPDQPFLQPDPDIGKQSKRALSDQEFLHQIDHSVPIGYINTAFGDLQSVTSALSDPYVDDSTVGSLSSRFLFQSAHRRSMLQEHPVEPMQPSGLPQYPIEPDWTEKLLDPAGTDRQFRPGGAFRTPLKAPERSVPTSERKAELSTGGCNFWETFLANMCEAVSPTPSQSITSPDNSKAVMTSMRASVRPKDFNNNTLLEKHTYRIEGKARIGRAGIELPEEGEATKDWMNSSDSAHCIVKKPDGTGRDNFLATLSHESSVIENSQSEGQRFPNDIDGFVKTAFENSRNEAELKSKNSNRNFSTRVPQKTKSRLSPDLLVRKRRDVNRCNELGPRNPTPVSSSSGEERRRAHNSDVIATKNLLRSETHAAKSSMLPVNKVVERSQLPPREPRRARVHEQKMAIARKKVSSASSHSSISNDIFMNGSVTNSVKSNVSKAKVRSESSSPLILRKRSSSTLPSIEY